MSVMILISPVHLSDKLERGKTRRKGGGQESDESPAVVVVDGKYLC